MRKPLRPNRGGQRVASLKNVPAPTGGWDAVSALEDMPADRAIVLDNWFPTPGDVRVRRGSKRHATGTAGNPVESLMVYNGVSSSKMFAAYNGSIVNVTASGTMATADLTGLSSDRWQSVNFTTTGGHFLWICNGEDAPRHYNGTAWATPSLTVSTFSASDIINVNAHKGRLWVVYKNSTVAGYLATGAIAGTVTDFELGGNLTKGGYLVAMGTFTRDGGAGEDDLAVFISSEGQVVIYAGTDPANAATWSKVGVFDLGSPIGRRCFAKVGGDLALVCVDGVLPLSLALQQDRGAAANIALTKNINNAMNEAARSYRTNFGWELTPYAAGTMAVLNVPISEGATQHQYVMNTLTGAWCRFKGMDANCWAVMDDELYFGGNDGDVNQADTSGSDSGSDIDAVGQGAYNYYEKGGLKQWLMVQPMLTTDTDSRPAIGLSTDFKDNASLGTPSVAGSVSAVFDVAVFDSDSFAVDGRSSADWTSISGIGQCGSLHFRASTGAVGVALWGSAEWGGEDWSTGSVGDVVMRLNGFTVTYERGGFL